MKVLSTTLILALGLAANAMDWTGRLEVRDSSTASSSCGSITACSTNSVVGFGLGVTTPVWNFAPDWSIVTGGLLRQRVGSISILGTTGSVTYLDLDIPADVQWVVGDFAIRLGVDLGFKLSSNYSTILTSSESDNSFITPIEVAVDWKFLPNQLINFTYENGVAVATGQNGTPNLATASVLTIGYGYQF